MLRHKSLHPLSHQHQHGLALCVLVERGLVRDRSEANVVRLAAQVRDWFELELVNHFALEEDLLFPVIESELGTSAMVAGLVVEHRRMEQMADEMRAHTSETDLLTFAALLRTHIRREENELFEQIQGRLSPETLERLGRDFEMRAVRVRNDFPPNPL
jgi:hemerythrin-like domain-containing protein